jgi:hypothetical protein
MAMLYVEHGGAIGSLPHERYGETYKWNYVIDRLGIVILQSHFGALFL